ncbi:MAG: YggU family protein [Desulfonatronovibrio sp. MSAO_Bac4]|nr:MAG: YggU family protein [Desulfonatronovibrio sp. MSAO_Bac4]
MDFLEKIDDSTWRVRILVQPGAKNSEIQGIQENRLKVRIQARPVEGKANKDLCSFLAQAIGIRKSQLQLEKGLTSRQKSILISGVSEDLRKIFIKKYNHFN